MFDFKKLDNFLDKPSDKQKLIIIYGPTACGKTSLSIKVAKYLNSEVISADSQQIFTGLDIGTGKVTKEEADGIPHHMIDIINPDEEYSVGAYKKDSEKVINNLYNQNKIPVICGGTGLYIDSLIYDFNIPKLPADWKLRDELEKQREEKGNDYIWEKLNEIDPEYAKTLHPNNHRYVIRGIEVKTLTGKSKLEFKSEKVLKYDVLFITPYDGNREELYNKINIREKQIFEEGLLEETKILLKKYSKDDFGMQSIGYKEMISYLEGEMSWDEAIEELQKNARHYAKRQLTWFRKYK